LELANARGSADCVAILEEAATAKATASTSPSAAGGRAM